MIFTNMANVLVKYSIQPKDILLQLISTAMHSFMDATFFSPKSCDLCHVTFYAKKQSSFCWDFSLLCYKVTIYFLYIVLHCLPLFVLFLLNVSIECPLCSDVMLFALFILYSHFRITESVISH